MVILIVRMGNLRDSPSALGKYHNCSKVGTGRNRNEVGDGSGDPRPYRIPPLTPCIESDKYSPK
jgi:hypothetical protein